jgi:hypothetical protein
MTSKPDVTVRIFAAGVKCSDGSDVDLNAFNEYDGKKVRLAIQHSESLKDTIGHAILHRDELGMLGDFYHNNTQAGQDFREMALHGDLSHVSMRADNLRWRGDTIVGGRMKEISWVPIGADPKAIVLQRGEYRPLSASHDNRVDADGFYGYDEFATGEPVPDHGLILHRLELVHADGGKKTLIPGLSEAQEEFVTRALLSVTEGEYKEEDGDKAVIDGMTEEQQLMFVGLLASSESENFNPPESVQHGEAPAEPEEPTEPTEKPNEIQHTETEESPMAVEHMHEPKDPNVSLVKTLSRKAVTEILHGAQEFGLRRSMMKYVSEHPDEVMHADDPQSVPYGINTAAPNAVATAAGEANLGITAMFPDASGILGLQVYRRPTEWVTSVMSKVTKYPKSRMKSLIADLTPDSARAKGYLKGNLKTDQFYSLAKRTTEPWTIVKRQRFDNDDLTDIDNAWNLIQFTWAELKGQIEEELAAAIILSDGRPAMVGAEMNPDKIDTNAIRPIYGDNAAYTTYYPLQRANGEMTSDEVLGFMRAVYNAKKDYKGSGSIDMIAGYDLIGDLLFATLTTGELMYRDEAAVRARLGVSSIITIPDSILARSSRTGEGGAQKTLAALFVDLRDYFVGTDRGGELKDVQYPDWDRNQQKFLVELRCSGSLMRPFSAFAFESDVA